MRSGWVLPERHGAAQPSAGASVSEMARVSRFVRAVANVTPEPGMVAGGNETAMIIPPSGRGRALSSARWALAMAWTMESPSP